MAPDTTLIPLSSAQREALDDFLRQGPNPMHNMVLTLRLLGPLDANALSRAVDDVLLRHEPLRTSFPATDGDGPRYQAIFPGLPPTARMRQTDNPASDTLDILNAEYGRAFDPTVEVPIRVRLLRISEDEHVLCIVLHHIAGDGWSLRVLCDDLGTAYSARKQGGSGAEPAWPPLEIRYSDYAYWQRDLLGDENDPASLAYRQLAYWRETLRGVPDELALPFDRPRPEVPSYHGVQLDANLDAGLHARLLELARAMDVTLFMIAQAAVCVVLARHGAGTDIPLSSVLAGRVEAVLEPLVGNFVNVLVLRTDLSGDPTFREVLDRVRAADLAAYDHADLPFGRVCELLPRAPQTMIAFDTGGLEELELDGLVVIPEPITPTGAKRDLAFLFVDSYDQDGKPAGIAGALQYASDLFDAPTVQLLADDLLRLLAVVAENPDIACLSEGGLPR
ncbi:MAG TPA: condensation domain-containing protein [Actinospica sp.]|jgi:hypothetical protein|nr:condensation domain-containing protein [Actinospica sp.]